MTFSTTSNSPAPAQIRDTTKALRQGSLIGSRETGDVLPNNGLNGASIAKEKAPVAKPWAHFVAGGYVHLDHL